MRRAVPSVPMIRSGCTALGGMGIRAPTRMVQRGIAIQSSALAGKRWTRNWPHLSHRVRQTHRTPGRKLCPAAHTHPSARFLCRSRIGQAFPCEPSSRRKFPSRRTLADGRWRCRIPRFACGGNGDAGGIHQRVRAAGALPKGVTGPCACGSVSTDGAFRIDAPSPPMA